MTRVCAYCQAVIGEKCGQCGSLDVLLRMGLVKPFWTCFACGQRWFEGQEPVTSGICVACYPKALQEVVPAA